MAPAAHFRKRPQACVILSAMDIMQTFDNAPIGVFDSGFGGLTVAREIAKALPEESIIYVGDSARCPYGPRSLSEVDGFVQQIGSWLVQRGVKLIVIACNTATAAGLAHAQQTFPVPVIGVVEPGARAAAHATRNKRVGVIATKATVESDAYTKAIRHLDAGITVFSTAALRRDSRAGHPHGGGPYRELHLACIEGLYPTAVPGYRKRVSGAVAALPNRYARTWLHAFSAAQGVDRRRSGS